ARGCAARSSPGAPPGCPWDAVRPAGAITVGTHDHGPVNTGTAGPWGVLTVRNEGPGRDVVAGRWATSGARGQPRRGRASIGRQQPRTPESGRLEPQDRCDGAEEGVRCRERSPRRP